MLVRKVRCALSSWVCDMFEKKEAGSLLYVGQEGAGNGRGREEDLCQD